MGFFFGAATSAYQIEGSVKEEGRGISIWDSFCQQKGHILDGSSGDVACNHYRLWQQDIALMKSLNLNAYRFSIAWPRIFPDQTLHINEKGLQFYDRLIDGLLEAGIEPFPTLYHWDLPQYIQDRGGWASRDTCHLFADYAAAVFNRFQDRVTHWTTLNEPYVSAFMGYLTGGHAPGIQSPDQALAAVHHLLLAHGMALKRMRDKKVGIALNLSPAYSYDASSQKAAGWYDMLHNQLFLDALFRKAYPEEFLKAIAASPTRKGFLDLIHPEDMACIGSPLDFLGINYYTRGIVQSDPERPLFACRVVPPEPNPCSDMWEFYPEGLLELFERIQRDYQPKELMVMENGTSLPEGLEDEGRIAYLEAHLMRIAQAKERGIPITGYFVWSLLDNFEWAAGYARRFGLVEVDFATQERRPRKSALWYARFISSSR
ncbi:MAG: beta-glucosidase [Parachlamydia sp.]|nr:beta-glucosidase [Parachlamydia sp.]